MGQLSESGNRVVLLGEYLWVYDVSGMLMLKVKRSSNRLYRIVIEDAPAPCFLSKGEDETRLWHARLGHVNFGAMKLMSANGMIYGIPDFSQPNGVCDGCLLSKQARTPFSSQTHFVAKEKPELIHGDLCGPISPPTPAGNRYFLLLVDDFSRKIWVYMLKYKSDALTTFKKFKKLVENETKLSIKVFRTDRGGEFTLSEFQEFCEGAGILRHLTTPYYPQQHGVVERQNRTVVEMTRSLLKEKNMPSMFWGEAVRHAVYILNRVPTRVLKGETPYEAWNGDKPNLGFVKIFGCIAHMKVPREYVQKLDDRRKRMVYLGNEPGSKAHRLFDPLTRRLNVSRDVFFEEDKGWNWTEQKQGNENGTAAGSFVIINTHDPEQHGGDVGFHDDDTGFTTPIQSHIHKASSEHGSNLEMSTNSGDSSEPKRFRLISDIYNDTQEAELPDELLFLSLEEPGNFKDAVKEPEWKKAMQVKMDAIEKNKTWVLTDLPPRRKPISLKWVYKLKKNTEGEIVKYKARLVVRGFVQKKGVDFEEVFALVARLETVRLLLALAARNGWEVHHLDVKSAFLNADLLEEVYMSQPEGFVPESQ